MVRKVLVLGACCAGKSSLFEDLRVDHDYVIECDDAIMRAAGGVWPSDADENRQLVIEVATQALAMAEVIFLTSWVPTEMLERARSHGFTVALIEVPRPELERRNRARLAAGGSSDVSHWFGPQLGYFAELIAGGLIDTALDGTQPIAHLGGRIRLLVQ